MGKLERRSLALADGARLDFLCLTTGATQRALSDALGQFDRETGLANVVRQTYFVPDAATSERVASAVSAAYPGGLPATTYVLQPLANGDAVAAEIWAIVGPRAVHQGDGAAVAEAGGAQWIFAGGLEVEPEAGPYDGTVAMLPHAAHHFAAAGASFGHIVRVWYYLGDILGQFQGESRYGLFNHARNEFYRDTWPDLTLSPASTGIGMLGNSIAFEGLAMRGHDEHFRVVWVDNPLQTPPYKYQINLKAHEQKPSFSRAAAVQLRGAGLIFVSGTASIRDSKVLEPDSVTRQTEITLENIATLIGGANLAKYGFARGAELKDLLQYRVYVKRPEDAGRVRDICRAQLGGIPTICMIADVCRPQFLMEIEGVATLPSA